MLGTNHAMTLKEYMKANRIKDAAMASLIPCSIGAVRKWKRHERIPRPSQIRRIKEVTDGAVCPDDFLGIPPDEKDAVA